MTEIVLIRHGQASFGQTNYDKLSQLGLKQAEYLGNYFAHNNFVFDALWCGDMVRHAETANGILAGLAVTPDGQRILEQVAEPSVKPGVNEFDFEMIAKAYVTDHPNAQPNADAEPAEFYRLLRKSMLAWAAGELNHHALSETWEQFKQRVMATLETASDSDYKRVVIATSGGAIAMAVSQVLGTDAATMVNLNLQIRNTSLTHLFANQSGRHLHQFNALPHLENPNMRHAISYS